MDLDVEQKKSSKESVTGPVSRETVQTQGFKFGDPADYEGYSTEDKQALTEEMMSGHKDWASKQ